MPIASSLRIAVAWLAAAVIAAAAPHARAGGPPDPADLVKPRLVAETAAVTPGSTLWVDLHLAIKSGWHVYWRNPGDSGLPTTLDWTLPEGLSAGAIKWPVPEHFVQNGIGNYGYAETADLLVPIAAASGLMPGGTVVLEGKASWLVCAEICIPGGQDLSLSLPVAARPPAPDPEVAALFAAARAHLPAPAPFETRFAAGERDYRILVPAAALAGLARPSATFFPINGTLIDAAAEPKTEWRGDGLVVVLPRTATAAAPQPATLDGVLVLRGAGGAARAFEISANPAAIPPGDGGIDWHQALALAFLGGIVLNAMPCVFPILFLKLLGLAQHAHRSRRERLGHGLAYTAGVLLSFAALGGALLALRGAGEAIGWGFQLQSPGFVAGLAYLLFAMGLSLSGVVTFGAALAGIGAGLADRPRLAGSFFTGVLASIVATPCTAPFMAAALGFALVAPAAVALAVFVALGLGLAAPYLVASLAPGWRRILPRPGAWMEFLKQLLAFPLYATVAWLFWVLLREVGSGDALAALFGLVLVAFAAWIYGRTRDAARLGRALGAGFAAAGAAAAITLALSLTAAPAGIAPAATAGRVGLPYEAFTPARLAALEAAGKPVFVNLTAAWCLTCLVNERVALDDAAVRRAFAAHGVVALKGDWTSQNPDITRLLERFGRSGVPLYLLYSGSGEPKVLPQILTASGVLDAVSHI